MAGIRADGSGPEAPSPDVHQERADALGVSRQQAKAASFGFNPVFGLGTLGVGRKDDQGKLRLEKIPAESLSLILEHCHYPVLGTPAERYTSILAVFSEHQSTGSVAALARATQGMLGLADLDSRVLLPARALEGVARVLEFGATRAGKDGTGYGWDNWQGVAAERYSGGFLRHLMAIGRGELLDNGPGGSSELHALNGACCGLFRLWQVGRRVGGGL